MPFSTSRKRENTDNHQNAIGFFDFCKKNVASEATLYLVTEPALLDNFIHEFQFINGEIRSKARLECILTSTLKK
jgi:hypothetical protein